MNISPLGFVYRFRPGVALEASTPERLEHWAETDKPDYAWSAMDVPGIQIAAVTPGELEAIIAARDAAVTEAMREPELVGVVDIVAAPSRQVTREESRSRGYTGNSCNVCGSMQMQIAGHCEVCAACGETTGCS